MYGSKYRRERELEDAFLFVVLVVVYGAIGIYALVEWLK